MSDNVKRFKTMLFKYETTTKTDFRRYKSKELDSLAKEDYKYAQTHGKIRRNEGALKDISSMNHWREPYLPPFDLFGKPKDIIRTDPRHLQEPYEVPDVGREHVRKTRPRVILTPAEKLDDMPIECYRIITDDIYTTSSHKAMQPTINLYKRDVKNIKSSLALPKTAAPANPIPLPRLRTHPYISPEWRMDSVSWDKKQLRSNCQPTKEFWLDKTRNNSD